MKNVDSQIKDYYNKQELSSDSMNRLLALGEQVVNESKAGVSNTGNNALAGFRKRAAMVLVASFLVTVFVGMFQQIDRSTSELVMAEIAMNHNKRLDSEYQTDSFEQLLVAMKKLDFDLKVPKSLSFDLLGGRYCSIQGKLAAQLKVKQSNSNKVSTLYVTPVTDRLNQIADQTVHYDNVVIRLWKDGEYFYGLADDVKPDAKNPN